MATQPTVFTPENQNSVMGALSLIAPNPAAAAQAQQIQALTAKDQAEAALAAQKFGGIQGLGELLKSGAFSLDANGVPAWNPPQVGDVARRASQSGMDLGSVLSALYGPAKMGTELSESKAKVRTATATADAADQKLQAPGLLAHYQNLYHQTGDPKYLQAAAEQLAIIEPSGAGKAFPQVVGAKKIVNGQPVEGNADFGTFIPNGSEYTTAGHAANSASVLADKDNKAKLQQEALKGGYENARKEAELASASTMEGFAAKQAQGQIKVRTPELGLPLPAGEPGATTALFGGGDGVAPPLRNPLTSPPTGSGASVTPLPTEDGGFKPSDLDLIRRPQAAPAPVAAPPPAAPAVIPVAPPPALKPTSQAPQTPQTGATAAMGAVNQIGPVLNKLDQFKNQAVPPAELAKHALTANAMLLQARKALAASPDNQMTGLFGYLPSFLQNWLDPSGAGARAMGAKFTTSDLTGSDGNRPNENLMAYSKGFIPVGSDTRPIVQQKMAEEYGNQFAALSALMNYIRQSQPNNHGIDTIDLDALSHLPEIKGNSRYSGMQVNPDGTISSPAPYASSPAQQTQSPAVNYPPEMIELAKKAIADPRGSNREHKEAAMKILSGK
jgi:hypothetical protein